MHIKANLFDILNPSKPPTAGLVNADDIVVIQTIDPARCVITIRDGSFRIAAGQANQFDGVLVPNVK